MMNQTHKASTQMPDEPKAEETSVRLVMDALFPGTIPALSQICAQESDRPLISPSRGRLSKGRQKWLLSSKSNDTALWSSSSPYDKKSASASQPPTTTQGTGAHERGPFNRTSHYEQLTIVQRLRLAATLIEKAVKRPSGCIEIPGVPLHSGHMQLSVGSPYTTMVRVRAHVFSWELANGRDVPEGLVVMHSCDNPRCVHPDHLSIGTQRQNTYDSIHKGRGNKFGRQKLNAAQVREIRRRAASGELVKDIAKDFGMSRSGTSQIITGACWAHVEGARPVVRRRLYPNGARG